MSAPVRPRTTLYMDGTLNIYVHLYSKQIYNYDAIFMMIYQAFTPFKNAQRWMGKNTFNFLLSNDDNMIGED